MRRLHTDVLVIGAGLAGLRAAIAARVAGARVIVAVKGKLGRSGASAMTTAGCAAVLPDAADDSPARHAADTIAGGGRIGDPELVRAMAEGAAAEVVFCESVGARFTREPDGRHRLSPSGDHSRVRVLLAPSNLGTDLTVPLAEHARAIGVEALEQAMALELAVAAGRVTGAALVDLKSGEPVAVAARAVVLATGGAGRLYTPTSNPNDVTGDGFALAYRAGAALRDMEFVQFYPWRCVDPFDKARVSIQPSTFVHGARLLNAAGERFMERFNPGGAEVSTRDVGARGIFAEMREGRGVGGGVRLDLSPLSKETFERSNPKVASYIAKDGIDHASYPFVVSPEAHYWMGGALIDADGRTTVPGLYAAGEVAGGVHGANRLNSNALPDCLVLGARAGAAAAREGAVPDPRGAEDAAHRALRVDPASGWTDQELAAELAALREAMWRGLGIIRDAAGLADARAHVARVLYALSARPPAVGGVRAYSELDSLATTAALAVAAALARTESRGAHYREDFPDEDRRQCGSLVVRRGAEGPKLEFSPAREAARAA